MAAKPEDELRDLRDDLAQLADRFKRLSEQNYREDRRVWRAAKNVDADVGETLLELDTYMGWDDD